MTSNELMARIEKLQNTILKKKNLIAKKTVLIEKKQKELKKLGVKDPKNETVEDYRYLINGNKQLFDDIFDLYYCIRESKDSIHRSHIAIKEAEKKIKKYREQLVKAEAIENVSKNLPEILKGLEAELVHQWDEYDFRRRQMLRDKADELDYHEFVKTYGYKGYDFTRESDENIHKNNAKDANDLVIDLYYRVKDITGEITDWSGIHQEYGNHSVVLNGLVKGKDGWAVVESIEAGGYNIQRWHIRVLVKKY